MNDYLNQVSSMLQEILNISTEILAKIKLNDIPKEQDEDYLLRTSESIYHRMKVFQKNILHLHSDSVYCLS